MHYKLNTCLQVLSKYIPCFGLSLVHTLDFLGIKGNVDRKHLKQFLDCMYVLYLCAQLILICSSDLLKCKD